MTADAAIVLSMTIAGLAASALAVLAICWAVAG